MKTKKEILEQFEEDYKASKSNCKRQWRHIRDCRSFYAGDYMNYKDDYAFGRGSSRRIKQVQFNRVKPYVNSVVGFMAQMRRKVDYQARLQEKNEQKMFTDYINGLSDYIRDNSSAVQMETRQDIDLVVGGIGATDTVITTKDGQATRDPNGEILTERLDMLNVGWDTQDTSPNLINGRYAWRARDYYVQEAMDLLDAEEEDFEHVFEDENAQSNLDFNPYGGIQDKIGFEWADEKKRMVRVYFYQWCEIEPYYRVENPLQKTQDPALFRQLAVALSNVENEDEEELFRLDPSASMLVVTKKNRKEVRDIFEAFEIPWQPIRDKRKVYYTAIISGKKLFNAFKSPSQQGFTIKFKTGFYDEEGNIWTGLVASMRDPQKYYNKALTELMLIIANNSRGGVIYEEDAVDNIQEFEAQWARTNAAVKVNAGALGGGKIQPKATPHMNTGYEEIIALSGQAFGQVTGIDESFFGAVVGKNETAMLQRQRIKQATTTLALYFDAIDLYAKEQGRMMLSFMRLLAESSDGKLFKMFDDDDNVIFEVLSLDFFVDEYEISIGETPETPVQKEYYTEVLMGMAQSMQAIGDPKYKEMYAAAVKYMPIPNRDKATIVRVLLGDEQIDPAIVQQMQQTIMDMQSEQATLAKAQAEANINKTNAETQYKLVDTRKKAADIGKTQEDTESVAIDNDLKSYKSLDEIEVTI